MSRRAALGLRFALALSVTVIAVQLWGMALRDDAPLSTPTFSLPSPAAAVAAQRAGGRSDGRPAIPAIIASAGLIEAPAEPEPGGAGSPPSRSAPPGSAAAPEAPSEPAVERPPPASGPDHAEPSQPARNEPPEPAGDPPTSSPETVPLPSPAPPPAPRPPRRHPPQPPPPSLTEEQPPEAVPRDGGFHEDEEERDRDHPAP